MRNIITTTLLALTIFISLGIAADPLATFTSESILGSKKLHKTLNGSTWIHEYLKGEFEFTFGKSGLIENHEAWEGVRWRVISPNEVILGSRNGSKMIFTFDDEVKTFSNIDWDGTPTTGRAEEESLSTAIREVLATEVWEGHETTGHHMKLEKKLGNEYLVTFTIPNNENYKNYVVRDKVILEEINLSKSTITFNRITPKWVFPYVGQILDNGRKITGQRYIIKEDGPELQKGITFTLNAVR